MASRACARAQSLATVLVLVIGSTDAVLTPQSITSTASLSTSTSTISRHRSRIAHAHLVWCLDSSVNDIVSHPLGSLALLRIANHLQFSRSDVAIDGHKRQLSEDVHLVCTPLRSEKTDAPNFMGLRNVKHDNARRAISKDRKVAGDGDVLSSACRSVDSRLSWLTRTHPGATAVRPRACRTPIKMKTRLDCDVDRRGTISHCRAVVFV